MSVPVRLNNYLRIAIILLMSFIYCSIDIIPVHAVSVVVNTTNDDEDIDDSYCSLREAISAIKIYDGNYYGCTGGDISSVITFDQNGIDPYIYTIDDQLPTISNPITINGESAETTIIQASSCNPTQETCTNDHELFWVSASGDLNLNHLTLRYGKNIDNLNGGVIYNGGLVHISYSVITDNIGVYGGAILNNGDLYISNSTISSNIAKNDGGLTNGGAIYNGPGHNIDIRKSTFSDNSAAGGGAILSYGNIDILNSTFSGNSATNFGGAIYEGTSYVVTVTNSTFSENAASQGAGLYLDGTLNFTNTIIANATAGDDCHNSGSIGINLNNLVEDGGCSATYSGDPSIGSLGNHGGLTQTHALLSSSIAIDAGDLDSCPDTDQRGVERPQLSGCDIGAYEKEPTTPIYLPLILK